MARLWHEFPDTPVEAAVATKRKGASDQVLSWSRRRDSNPRPSPWQPHGALPWVPPTALTSVSLSAAPIGSAELAPFRRLMLTVTTSTSERPGVLPHGRRRSNGAAAGDDLDSVADGLFDEKRPLLHVGGHEQSARSHLSRRSVRVIASDATRPRGRWATGYPDALIGWRLTRRACGRTCVGPPAWRLRA